MKVNGALKSPTLWLAIFNIIVASFAGYIGLRLEPLYIRLQRVEQMVNTHEQLSRGVIEDYIAFKAQTIEILRQQNQELDEVKIEVRRIRAGS